MPVPGLPARSYASPRGAGLETAGAPSLYLVTGGSIASHLLAAAALWHLPPTGVGIIGKVEPVVASGVAWVVPGKHLSPAQLAGGLLLLAGAGSPKLPELRDPAKLRNSHPAETAR